MATPPVHVVVLGAGFGGLTFCQKFNHPRARVTVVDRANHHLFQPLLYQVATAGLAAPDIAQPIRSILSEKERLVVLMDEVLNLDLANRRVVCRRTQLQFDYLVVALGSMTGYFGNRDWEQIAPGLKTLDDAFAIRARVLSAFEEAEASPDPVRQQKLMTIVVVGGGPTGVELAGACAELAHRVLRKDFDHIDPARARIILVEASTEVLSHLPADLGQSARAQLVALGVQVLTSCRVAQLTPDRVVLNTGETIEAATVLWAAGVQANAITRQLGAELDRAGRVKVAPDLTLPGHPEVFVIGDLVHLVQANGTPVPGVAPAAMQMAKYARTIISDELDLGRGTAPRPPFRYRDKGTLATIGRSKGVAQFGRFHLHGYVAWLSWLLVHLLFLIGFRNKLSVLAAWTYNYFTYKLGARIILGK